ncbi:sensor histidine kinase [Paenibacillus xanthanilyticus]|uniref:histidine kinase n=2 Tax=Paenibacillus xanthanilyticus TaxID=1783531 RepID=A0ABV8K3V1_9BACL
MIWKWILLLACLTTYMWQNPEGSVIPVLAAAGLQAVHSIAVLSRSLNRFAVAATSADLLFQAYLLWSTGGSSSPFLVYTLASLAFLKIDVGWKWFYMASGAYLSAISVLFAIHEGMRVHSFLGSNGPYLILVFFYFSFSVAAQSGTANISRHIRSLVYIYSAHRLLPQSSTQTAARHAEGILRKMLKGRGVWLCIDVPSAVRDEQSWMHTYYRNQLGQHAPIARKTFLRLLSPSGEAQMQFVRSLRTRGGIQYGWLLIETNPGELSLLEQTYINLLLLSFETHYEMNKRLAEYQDSAVTIERDRIAQDIHDGIAQELFFMSIQLFQIKGALRSENPDGAMKQLAEMETRVKESHADIRKLITELKGEKRKFNLHEAVGKMLHRIIDHTGVQLAFEHAGWVPRERIEIEETIYHFIEEAANNVIKHARANKLTVRLEVTSVQWTIAVMDDGIGLHDAAALEKNGKFGMKGMANRIKAMNGSIGIQAEEGKGTTITAAIPRERSLTYV